MGYNVTVKKCHTRWRDTTELGFSSNCLQYYNCLVMVGKRTMQNWKQLFMDKNTWSWWLSCNESRLIFKPEFIVGKTVALG